MPSTSAKLHLVKCTLDGTYPSNIPDSRSYWNGHTLTKKVKSIRRIYAWLNRNCTGPTSGWLMKEKNTNPQVYLENDKSSLCAGDPHHYNIFLWECTCYRCHMEITNSKIFTDSFSHSSHAELVKPCLFTCLMNFFSFFKGTIIWLLIKFHLVKGTECDSKTSVLESPHICSHRKLWGSETPCSDLHLRLVRKSMIWGVLTGDEHRSHGTGTLPS